MPEQIDTSSTSDGQTSKFPEKRWSLLVGVNSAPESDKPLLDHAENDVLQMAQILQGHCGFESFREPLLGTMATSGNVMKAIGRFISERKDDEFLLFYFSGHGIACKFGETNDDDDIYLVTSDFSPLDIDVNPGMHLSLKLLRKMLYEQCYAGKVLIILDCCYAGNISGHGPDLDREELVKHLARYLDINVSTASNTKGLRLALAATAYNKAAYVVDGHGPLARWLIPALSGEANDAIDSKGRVTFNSLRDYLQDQMSEYPPSASGGDAGRNCILAYHSKHPNSHFPYGHDPLFRPREGEFERMEAILRTKGDAPVRLGLTGMGGVGKSLLARELVLHTREYFTDGVFWATATVEGQPETGFATKDNPLIHALAELAMQTSYLPPGDDPAYPNEELRARYFCRFVAQHPHALLILDNLDDPNMITTKLSDLASMEPQCAVLYTSREAFAPSGIKTHQITPLNKVQDLLHVLLYNVPGKEDVLALEGTNETSRELEAAHSICKRVGGLPLALVLLRSQLETNSWLTLAELDQELEQYGVLALAQDEFTIKTSLRATFELSWRKVHDEHARQMFQLASYFPEVVPIPLWLLAYACDLPEEYQYGSSLMKSRLILRRLSLIEDISKHEIQIHPLLREFGQEIAQQQMPERSQFAERVIAAFENVQRLEQCARSAGFWQCLAHLRVARAYVTTVQPDLVERLHKIERRMDRETFLLATSGLWPDQIQGLFYQQMYNRILEEQQQLPLPPPQGTQWLRQLERAGTEDDQLIRVFAGHSGGINSVAFSPNSSKVLTGSEDTTARIFDTASGEVLQVLRGHTSIIESVAYSPNGSCVLTGSRDTTARLWNAETGVCLRIFTGHKDWINAIAFSPDGTCIATASQDGTVRIWEYLTDNPERVFKAPNRFSTRTEEVYPLELWNKRNNEFKEEQEDRFIRKDITSIVFSPDSLELVLATSSGSIYIWNILQETFTNFEQRRFANQLSYNFSLDPRDSLFVMSIASSPDGRLLLIGYLDGTVQIWDRVKSLHINTLTGHTAIISSVAFSHDPEGRYILTGSWDGTAKVWETRSGKLLHTFSKQAGTVNSVTFSPDDTMILAGLSDWTARLWMFSSERIPSLDENISAKQSISDNQTLENYPTMGMLARALLSSNGTYIAALYTDSTVRVWHTSGRQEIHLPDTYYSSTMELALSPDGNRVALASVSNTVDILSLPKGAFVQTLSGHRNTVWSVAFSPDGQQILTGSADTTARLWNITTGRTLIALKGHTGGITCVAFSPDETHLLTGSDDGTARLWQKRGKTYIPIVLSGHDGGVSSVAFSHDGTRAFTNSHNAPLRVWDTLSGSLLDEVRGRTNLILPIAPSSQNGYVLSGHEFNQIQLWHLDYQGQALLQGTYITNTRIVAARWQDDKNLLLADDAGPDQCPRIYKLRLED
jgi:WD40 repeat protein